MPNIFETMTKDEALAYCDTHKLAFIASGKTPVQFAMLRNMVASGQMNPKELPEYGMDFEETILPETRIKQLEEALKPFVALYEAARDPEWTGPGIRRGYSLAHGYNDGDPAGAIVTDEDYIHAYKVLHGGR